MNLIEKQRRFEVVEPPTKIFESFRAESPWKKSFRENVRRALGDPQVERFALVTHRRLDFDSLVAIVLAGYLIEHKMRQGRFKKPIEIEYATHGSKPYFEKYRENNPYVFERAGIIFVDIGGGRFDGHRGGNKNIEHVSTTSLVWNSFPRSLKERHDFVWGELVNLVEEDESFPSKESFSLPRALKTVSNHSGLSEEEVFQWGEKGLRAFNYAERMGVTKGEGSFAPSWLKENQKLVRDLFDKALIAAVDEAAEKPGEKELNRLIAIAQKAMGWKRAEKEGLDTLNIFRLAAAYRELRIKGGNSEKEAENEVICWLAQWIEAYWRGAERYSSKEAESELEKAKLLRVQTGENKFLRLAFLASEETGLAFRLINPQDKFKADVGVVMASPEQALKEGQQLFIRFNERRVSSRQIRNVSIVLRAWERFKREGERYKEGLGRLGDYEGDMPGDPFFVFNVEKNSFIAVGSPSKLVREKELTVLEPSEVVAALEIGLNPLERTRFGKLYDKNPEKLRDFLEARTNSVVARLGKN